MKITSSDFNAPYKLRNLFHQLTQLSSSRPWSLEYAKGEDASVLELTIEKPAKDGPKSPPDPVTIPEKGRSRKSAKLPKSTE